MGFGNAPNPGIWGDSVRKALNPNEERNARERTAGVERSLLDDAELRALERSGSYDDLSEAPAPSRLRRIVARIFRRPA